MKSQWNNESITSFHRDIVRDIKERFCKVTFESETLNQGDQGNQETREYILPDGNSLKLGIERFQAANYFFNPKILKKQDIPLPEAVFDVIQSCDPDQQKELYQHILLCGGSTGFPGFKTRLEKELQKFVSANIKINIQTIPKPNHQLAVWQGGAQYASTSSVQWASKAEYLKSGPNIFLNSFDTL